MSRPIDGRSGRFSISMRDTALNEGGLPGATVRFALRITGRFTGRHSASGTIRFSEGCTIPARYAPWRAIG